MAWRIDKNIIKGVIHSQTPGKVTGEIWLKGINTPIQLNLTGNPYRDLAGSRLYFKNPNPVEGDYSGMDLLQDGVVGDMTASKKVKVLTNEEEYFADYKAVAPNFTWKNSIYLEWFSRSNGRVLIETVDFDWKISLPNWRMSEDEESEQRIKNQQAMFNFMDEISDSIEKDEDDFVGEGEMNEFQWEAYLQQNDARSDMLLELFEKYEDDPNCENLIAEAMGWKILDEEDELDEEDDIVDLEEFDFEEDEIGDYIPSHPIIISMMDIASRIFYEAESRSLLSDDSNNPWNQLLWHSQMTVSKLIAALEEVSEGMNPEPGFVVATLKRALHLIHVTIATLEAAYHIEKKRHIWTTEIRRELFALRETIYDLMQTYRKQGE